MLPSSKERIDILRSVLSEKKYDPEIAIADLLSLSTRMVEDELSPLHELYSNAHASFWKNFREQRTRYAEEKKRVGRIMKARKKEIKELLGQIQALQSKFEQITQFCSERVRIVRQQQILIENMERAIKRMDQCVVDLQRIHDEIEQKLPYFERLWEPLKAAERLPSQLKLFASMHGLLIRILKVIAVVTALALAYGADYLTSSLDLVLHQHDPMNYHIAAVAIAFVVQMFIFEKPIKRFFKFLYWSLYARLLRRLDEVIMHVHKLRPELVAALPDFKRAFGEIVQLRLSG